MADKTITVRENSRPTITFELTSFRNEADPDAVVNITGYAFKLMVKRSLDDTDSQALVDVAGSIVSAAAGTFKFDLTAAHTTMPPRSYPGEIRWWTDGVTTNPPHDAFSVDFTVTRAVDDTV